MAEYIEREALKKHLFQEAARCALIFKDGESRGYIGAAKSAEVFPAADVAPVVHGRWIHEEKGGFHSWRCSRCGRGMNDNPEGTDFFCYHCGARMDEEEET